VTKAAADGVGKTATTAAAKRTTVVIDIKLFGPLCPQL
jgi:hypothetical protein